MTRVAFAAMLAAGAFVPVVAEAQRAPARRQQSIEIIGQVPTPQVVTVRPREVPAYDRRVLVPTFYDHDFWQSILPGYLLVRERMIIGTVAGDSAAARRDSTPPAITNAPAGTVTPPPTGSPPPLPASTAGQPAARPVQPPAVNPPSEDARRNPPAAVSTALPPR